MIFTSMHAAASRKTSKSPRISVGLRAHGTEGPPRSMLKCGRFSKRTRARPGTGTAHAVPGADREHRDLRRPLGRDFALPILGRAGLLRLVGRRGQSRARAHELVLWHGRADPA